MSEAQQRADDEWFLRRVGEDGLAGGTMGLLPARARALVAVGRISPDAAVAILRAYQQALSLRDNYDGYNGYEASQDPSALPSTMRVSTCARTVQQPWGSVRLDHVIWTGKQTRLRAVLTRTDPAARPTRGHGHLPRRYAAQMGYGGPQSLTVVDERGQTHEGYFSGGGSDTEWDGTFTFEPGLPADASWFTIYGERVELAPNPTDVRVHLDPTAADAAPEDLAERYLAFCVESRNDMDEESSDDVDLAIDTFVMTGVLAADSPAIRGVRAAQEALGNHGPFGRRRRRHKRSASPELPAQWRSVLARRGRKDGLVHNQVAGAITPPFDGVAVCVIALRSRADDFEIDIDATLSPDPLHVDRSMERRFAVTAVDDRSNHYLGETREWNGGDDSLSGTIAFGAPLDPLATAVDITLSTGLARVLVSVPLHRSDPL